MRRLAYLLLALFPLTPTMADDLVLSIGSESDFRAFTASVNNGDNYTGQTVRMTVDIALPTGDGNWTPIGTTSRPFNGTFDGQGHWVSNLYVNVDGSVTGNVAGLFGCIGPSATVKRVGVASGSVHISAKTSSDVNCYVGGIVGLNHGTIQQCANKATILGNWTMANVGGIAGANGNIGGGATTATIGDCYNQGQIFTSKTDMGDSNYLGGIVGDTDGTVQRVYSNGAVTSAAHYGNIYGYKSHDATVTNAYDSGLTGTALDGSLNTAGDYSVWTFTDGELPELTCFVPYCITLVNNADNQTTLDENVGRLCNVTLSGRTLYKDNAWNTLCLPFDISDITGTPLEGATVRTLESSTYNSETGVLTLDFCDAVTHLEAGRPYIVKWEDGANIVDPVFQQVTVSNSTSDIATDDICFKGTYSPFGIAGEDRTKLYLAANNRLYYPNAAITIASCRAYFQLEDLSANVRSFLLNFDDGEVTSIHNTSLIIHDDTGAWYSLDGRTLQDKPTAKGIYVHQGRRVIIK